jgi:hypothetical protein
MSMAKLIRSHNECGYKLMGMCLYQTMGMHKLLSAKNQCNPVGEENFPKCCPLPDGIELKNINYEKGP